MNLELVDVAKAYEGRLERVEVLKGISLKLASGAAVVVTGPSGSGKSTLLHLIGTLDEPSAGSVLFDDNDPFGLPERDLARFRNRNIGFVFQDHYLLPQYTVLENVLVPTKAFPDDTEAVTERAAELLERVGLSHRLKHRPAELSGGERQRVAIARALINQPSLVLCDEPTGNLDVETAGKVADLLLELHGEENNLLIVVTHSLELAGRFGKRFELREGRCSAA